MSKVENLQSVAKSARHRWEPAVGTVRRLNLVVALVGREEDKASLRCISDSLDMGVRDFKRSRTCSMTRDIACRV